jgi:hypothetical protein
MEDFKLKISVINPDYDPVIEQEWGFLNRQYENSKYNSEEVIGFKELKEYRYKDNINYTLKDVEGNNYDLKNVCTLELINEDDRINTFIFSKSLISHTRELNREKYQSGYFYIYLLGDVEFVISNKCIYLNTTEIPKELL